MAITLYTLAVYPPDRKLGFCAKVLAPRIPTKFPIERLAYKAEATETSVARVMPNNSASGTTGV